MVQCNRRSPFNFRRILGVPKGRNPKAIALCASAFLKLRGTPIGDRNLETVHQLLSWLVENRSQDFAGISWGYNFDWQSRSFFVAKGSPNAVCTIFAASAFLDAFEMFGDPRYLEVARESCVFLIRELLVRQDGEIHFRYIPAQDTQIHNVNLLAAALLARTAKSTGESQWIDYARDAITFSMNRQRTDGSWPYGEASNLQWIDNYHTGYNIVALQQYQRYCGDYRFMSVVRNAYDFWERHLFMPDGAPKLYHDRRYPVDIHCVAQAILTYLELDLPDREEKLTRIVHWALRYMWSSRGYFWFQRHRFYVTRIPYVRWSTAWMLYALSHLCSALRERSQGFHGDR